MLYISLPFAIVLWFHSSILSPSFLQHTRIPWRMISSHRRRSCVCGWPRSIGSTQFSAAENSHSSLVIIFSQQTLLDRTPLTISPVQLHQEAMTTSGARNRRGAFGAAADPTAAAAKDASTDRRPCSRARPGGRDDDCLRADQANRA